MKMTLHGHGCYEESLPDENITVDFENLADKLDDVFREDMKKELLELLQGFDFNVSEALWEDECDGCHALMQWQQEPVKGYACPTKGCWNNEETHQEMLREN
jgi:hypothetical protein